MIRKSLTVFALVGLMSPLSCLAASDFQTIGKIIGAGVVVYYSQDLPKKVVEDFNRLEARKATTLTEDIINVGQAVGSTLVLSMMAQVNNEGLVKIGTTGAIVGGVYVVLNRLVKRHDTPLWVMATGVLGSAIGRLGAEKAGLPVLNVSKKEGVNLDSIDAQASKISNSIGQMTAELEAAKDLIRNICK